MNQRFTLRPARPVRALGISAVLDVLAAVLLVLRLFTAASSLRTVLIVIAFVLLALGLALAVLAFVAHRRLTTTVEVDDRGISIRSAGRQAGRRWSEINRVLAQPDRIYLHTDADNGETLQIVCPRGSRDPEVDRLVRLLARRLDQDRGFQSL